MRPNARPIAAVLAAVTQQETAPGRRIRRPGVAAFWGWSRHESNLWPLVCPSRRSRSEYVDLRLV